MSTSSSDLSVASTKVNGDLQPLKERQSGRRKAVADIVHTASAQDILLFLVAFRILNALTIGTFFQPDEYFQSLEPAWRMAFGEDSGAWITWVCSFASFTLECSQLISLYRNGRTRYDLPFILLSSRPSIMSPISSLRPFN